MNDKSDTLIPRPVSDSQSEMNEIVLPNDANPLGALLGGRLMHWIDMAGALAAVLGGDLQVAIRAYDGSHAGPSDASATLVIRSPVAVRRVLSSPGELGFARAFVAGDIDVDGDIYPALAALRRP